MVVPPRVHGAEDHLPVLIIHKLDDWSAAFVEWRSPAWAILACQGAAASSSSSGRASPSAILACQGVITGHGSIVRAMALRAFKGVSKATLLQHLASKVIPVPDRHNMYSVVLTAVKACLPEKSEAEILEIMACRHFEEMSETDFVSSNFAELAVDDKDVEEITEVETNVAEVREYRTALADGVTE